MTTETSGLWKGADGRVRCAWCRGGDDYVAYHDTEWGFPVRDDRRRFEPDAKSRPKKITWDAVKAMPTTPESVALSKDLRKRGWSFVGPTTMYAFMQAMGLVNDHLHGCAFRDGR